MKREDAEKLIKKVEKDVKKALNPIFSRGGYYLVSFGLQETDNVCMGLNGSIKEISDLVSGISLHILQKVGLETVGEESNGK